MKNHIQWLMVLALLGAVDAMMDGVFAQNTVFTYQGRVLDSGTAFTGTGQFEFALVTSTNNNQQATATATVSGHFVTIINVVSGGSGYTTSPAVTISGGGGSGATATANLSGGVVASYTVNTTGSGYTGTPTVTVGPPPPDLSYATYWSNDGTSVNGSQPAAAVGVAVTNGLFAVELGNTSLVNMTAIPSELFAVESSLQLRIWFNDGANGFAVLSPLQNLTPTPYATFANSASNVLGAVATTQLTGTVPTTQLSGTIPVSEVTGTVPLGQLPAGVLTNGATGVTVSGTFTGNGAGVTNVALSSLGGYVYGAFQLCSQTPIGNYATYGALADVNGDGKTDVVCVISGNNTLIVMTNNGFGVLSSNATYGVSGGPVGVVAADVNGDGKVDLITANGAGTLTVLTNNRFGGFGSNAVLNVGGTPSSVVAADVNGDGKVDLVSANGGAGTLTVLTNNGFGVFGSNATLNAGASLNCVTAANLNGDGKIDLITANSSAGTVTIFTNNGSGVFGSNATINAGFEPVFVTAADINGNGKLALICANYNYGGYDGGNGTLTVLTNNGAGIFSSNATYVVGTAPCYIVAADVNGDGLPDLICANNANNSESDYGGNGTLTVLLNNGSGGFASEGEYGTGYGYGPNFVGVADLNGDGHPDLVTGAYTYNAPYNFLLVFTNYATFPSAVLPGFVGDQNAIGGGSGNTTGYGGGQYDVIGGGQGNVVGANGNSIGGGEDNMNHANGPATIGGGQNNSINGYGSFGTVAGGAGNSVTGSYGVVAGGQENTAGVQFSMVGGGFGNSATGEGSFVGGGGGYYGDIPNSSITSDNVASGTSSFVGGGSANTASGGGAVVCGGGWDGNYFSPNVYGNTASAEYSAVVGGSGNLANNGGAFVGGGYHNQATGQDAAINGGANNVASALDATVGGGNSNTAQGQGAFVGGGGYDGTTVSGNLASGNASVVGGGLSNQATNTYATVGGGEGNSAGGGDSTVAGGQQNSSGSSSDHTFIGGGWYNVISANDYEGTIAGGYYNSIVDIFNNAAQATIGGGEYNTNSSNSGTVGGGQLNLASGQFQSSVGGGYNNTASGSYATVPGGFQNVAAGVSSFAGGARAEALNQGTFVWADNSTSTPFISQADNQFLVRAQGGMGINMQSNPDSPETASLYVQGANTNGWQNSVVWFQNTANSTNTAPALRVINTSSGAINKDGALSVSIQGQGLIAEFGNSGAFVVNITNDGTIYCKTTVNTSDRNLKHNFSSVDAQTLLAKVAALPITEWNYKDDDGQRHLGPMAQDFYSAFHLGPGDTTIATIDENGVALAAIQGLNEKLETENADLRQQLAELRAAVRQLQAK